MMKIQESGENYLETILLLQNKKGSVRSVDIAEELGFTKPSISRAMGILKESGYITMEPRGEIRLTEAGAQKASEIYERHRVIAEYFVLSLNMDRKAAERDACRVEHIISRETFDHIKTYVAANRKN